MKLILVLLTLSLSACSNFQMSRKEMVWQTLHAIDAAQTLQIAKHPECFGEGNAFTRELIGEHPSEKNVLVWWLTSAITYHFVDQWFAEKPKDVRNAFRFVTIADAFRATTQNANDGLYLTHSKCED